MNFIELFGFEEVQGINIILENFDNQHQKIKMQISPSYNSIILLGSSTECAINLIAR